MLVDDMGVEVSLTLVSPALLKATPPPCRYAFSRTSARGQPWSQQESVPGCAFGGHGVQQVHPVGKKAVSVG
eukprot:2310771-Pyramimonas_sp.AAC.1